MSYNTFGTAFRFTTWGESHGPAVGVVIDGCPPGIPICEDAVQQYLDARKPGRPLASQRREPDKARILSGVFEGRTTGTPISIMTENEDARSKDYGDLQPGVHRPGHADATYEHKYGVRDPRGGGRASARETWGRVAAGAIARLIIPQVDIKARVTQVGHEFNPEAFGPLIEDVRKRGTSIGGVVICVATGVPAGWGAPIYRKLDAEIASAMMGINAVKGVEIGDGFALAQATQLEAMMLTDGGTAGGISDGTALRFRVAFKPTPSTITSPVPAKGRHDPCVAIRGAAVVEAMCACVLADQFLLHRAQIG